MAANSPAGQIYATLLLTDSYLPGALVLAHSLRDAGATRKLALFFTADTVSQTSLSQAQMVYDYIIPVPRLQTNSRDSLYAMNRPDLHSTFTKINLWSQTNFSKIVYIDSDVVAYRAPDELFDISQRFSAAPDIGWPDIFNSGVMVLTPNLGDYYALLAMAERGISFDGADQGLLNLYFKNTFNRISFAYNVTPSGHYQYIPAYHHFQSTISMVHFIGQSKPWFQNRHSQSAQNSPFVEMVGRWWAVYDRHYREQEEPYILPDLSGRVVAQKQQLHAHNKHQHVSQSSVSTQLEIIQPVALPASVPSIISPAATEQHISGSVPPEASTEQPAWDAQRQSPPTDSKPEAINFPATHYEMSEDATPFVAPNRYPSPPKNMWYDVPTTRPANSSTAPAAIFPWESKQPEPTRAFPVRETSKESEPTGRAPEEETPVTTTAQSFDNSVPTEPVSPWASFRSVNAWDELPAINKYVQARNPGRGQRQKLPTHPPLAQPTPQKVSAMRLTDFPSENDRPSLPVTPAPVRRASFWGTDEASDKPAEAPLQQHEEANYDWNPKEQLQKLATQHSDDLLRKLEQAATEAQDEIPTRDLPFGSETSTKIHGSKHASATSS